MPRADTVIRLAWEKHLDAETRGYKPFVIDAEDGKLPSRTRKRLFPLLFNIRGAGEKLLKGGILTDEQDALATAAIADSKAALEATPAVHRILIDLYTTIRNAGDPFLGADPESQLLAIAFDHARSGRAADPVQLADLVERRRANDRSLNSADLKRAISQNRQALETRLSQRWAVDPPINRATARSAQVTAIVQRVVDQFAFEDGQAVIVDEVAATTAWIELLSSPDVARYRSSRAMMLASDEVVAPPALDGRSAGGRPLDETIKRRITRLFQGDNAPLQTHPLATLEQAVDGSAEAYGLRHAESQAAMVVALDVARRILMADSKAFGTLWDGSFRVEWIRSRARYDSAFWAAHNLLLDPTEEILRRLWNRVFRAELAGTPVASPLAVWTEVKGTIVSVREDLVSEVGDVDVDDDTGTRPDQTPMAKIVEVIIEAGFGEGAPEGHAFLAGIGARHVIDDSATQAQFDANRSEWQRCVEAAISQRRFTTDALPSFSQLLAYLKRVLDRD